MKDTKRTGLVSPKLPRKVIVNLNDLNYEESDLQSAYFGDIVGDYLSDKYGFCHYGFLYHIDGNKVICHHIRWDTSN